jgi:hypothetical protein
MTDLTLSDPSHLPDSDVQFLKVKYHSRPYEFMFNCTAASTIQNYEENYSVFVTVDNAAPFDALDDLAKQAKEYGVEAFTNQLLNHHNELRLKLKMKDGKWNFKTNFDLTPTTVLTGKSFTAQVKPGVYFSSENAGVFLTLVSLTMDDVLIEKRVRKNKKE